jgi:hypothetical protein
MDHHIVAENYLDQINLLPSKILTTWRITTTKHFSNMPFSAKPENAHLPGISMSQLPIFKNSSLTWLNSESTNLSHNLKIILKQKDQPVTYHSTETKYFPIDSGSSGLKDGMSLAIPSGKSSLEIARRRLL